MTELPTGLAVLSDSAPSLDGLYRQALRAAQSTAPILILGEQGSGRSTLARAIHGASARSASALIEVDSGGVPTSLFESEFFGHAAGAFTGAEKPSEGRVGRADGGSLLLDHVEEIPLAAQAKLLRLLSDGRYVPLGSAERQADVRFMAIGTDRLSERVADGSFREDLFYRLEVVALKIPALRQRRSDLDSTVGFFLGDLGARFDRLDLTLSDRAREWFQRYSWPGNLREVRNVLERALVLTDGSVLDPEPPAAEAPPQSLAQTERNQIKKALAFTRGHQGRAAELLGISRKALWEKRKRHGLP